MNKFESLGLVASALIVFSMLFKTSNYKGTLIMRAVNALGSIAFTIYGFLLPAYSTGIANAILFIIHVVYFCIEFKDYKKTKNKKETD